MNNNVQNVSPDIIRAASKTLSTEDNTTLQNRVDRWNELLFKSPDLGDGIMRTVLVERASGCNPELAGRVHLMMVDFGFQIAIELVRDGKLDKQTVEKFQMGFGPRKAA